MQRKIGNSAEERVAWVRQQVQAAASRDLWAHIRFVVNTGYSTASALFGRIDFARQYDVALPVPMEFPCSRLLVLTRKAAEVERLVLPAFDKMPIDLDGVTVDATSMAQDWSAEWFGTERGNDYADRPCIVAQAKTKWPDDGRYFEPLVNEQALYLDVIDLIGSAAFEKGKLAVNDARRSAILLVFHDYRARFAKAEVRGSRVRFGIDGDDIADVKVTTRLTTEDGTLRRAVPARPVVAFDVGADVSTVEAALVKGVEILDYRHQGEILVDTGVDSQAGSVEAVVAGGESATVEFKPWIDLKDSKVDQVVNTAVAFANCGGGQLLIGIEDDGELSDRKSFGMATKKKYTKREVAAYARRLRDIVQKAADTSMEIRAQPAKYARGWVAVLTVKAGTKLPYMHKRYVWVRHNATTTRVATTAEMQRTCQRNDLSEPESDWMSRLTRQL